MESIERLVLGAFATNCYLLKEEGHTLIIDPAARFERILSAIKETEKVEAILLTHGHFDHIGAVDKLQARFHCPVYLNPKDEKLARSAKLNSMGEWKAEIHCPTTPLVEGILPIGPFKLEIIEAPGHTAGSTLIRYKQHLFVGDVLFRGSIGRTDLYSASDSAMAHSLRMIKTLDENLIVYPGHDGLTTLKEELENNPFLQ